MINISATVLLFTFVLSLPARADHLRETEAGVRIRLEFANAADKPSYVLGYLNRFIADQNSVRLDVLKAVIDEARDAGVAGLENTFDILRDQIFTNDQMMVKFLEDSKTIIRLPATYSGQALYEAALASPNKALQDWAVHALTKKKTIANQTYANNILVKLLDVQLLNPSDAALEPAIRSNQAYALKEAIDEAGFLRAENFNPSLEAVADMPGAPLAPPDALVGWPSSNILPNKTKYPILGVKGASFQRCLEVDKPTSATTYIMNDRLNFSAALPRRLEFALSYMVPYPNDGLVAIGAGGISYLKDDGFGGLTEGAGHAFQIKLSAVITLTNNTTITQTISEDKPYRIGQWQKLEGKFICPDSRIPIKSVYLQVAIPGEVECLYLDDIFVRRAMEEFVHAAPEIVSVSASPATVAVVATCQLSIHVQPGEGDGTIIGQWYSDIDGVLGSPVTMNALGDLIATVMFSHEGKHSLSLSVKNGFGLESVAYTSVTVVSPQVTLATTADLAQPVSGNLSLSVTTDGKYLGVPDTYLLSNEIEINLANGSTRKVAVSSTALSYSYALNTRQFPDGVVLARAAVYVTKRDPATGALGMRFGPFYSNMLQMYLANNASGPVAVIFIDSQENSNPLIVHFNGSYSQGPISSYYWNFGDGGKSTAANPTHSFINNTILTKTFNVTLQVKDASGASNSATSSITVAGNAAPPAT